MPDLTLFDRIMALPKFSATYADIVSESVSSQFRTLTSPSQVDNPATRIDMGYALECAAVLARAPNGAVQDAALRIAHYCLERTESKPAHRAVAALVLDTMTNRRAIDLAVERRMLTAEDEKLLPAPIQLDIARRNFVYSISSDGGLHNINAFQLSVYQSLDEAACVSLSAPTSSGKSYILKKSLARSVRDGARVCIYLVPTRALIQEVELDLQKELIHADPPEVNVSSIPRVPKDWKTIPTVLILTQERLHWLLNNAPGDFRPDLLIVDEAHKIGDGSRGILLDEVLESVIRRSPQLQVVFSSPMTRNPGVLLRFRPHGAQEKTILSEHVSVNQNLLWVSQVPHSRRWQVELCRDSKFLPLGEIATPHAASPATKRLPFVAHAMAGKESGNLVYVNGPADAERAAHLLWDLQGSDEDISSDPEVKNLIDLVRRTVHKEYALAQVLERRVAFHYGNMPLLMRTEVERLFKNGKLQFLVCTSTLVEGVNLPARSIYVRGPERGRNKPMDEMDFWNLAGRAGRLGREFQGNVVCVDPRDPSVWTKLPPTVRTRYSIKISLDEVASSRGEELLVAVEESASAAMPSRMDGELEYAFARLFAEHLRVGSIKSSPRVNAFELNWVDRLDKTFERAKKRLDVPDDVLFRNPGVNPFAMQALLVKFVERHENLAELIPVDPHEGEATKVYVRVVGLISQCFTNEPQALVYARAILVVNWMRGWPLARIIQSNIDYWSKKKPKALATVIRETMRDVEEYARFKFAKYASCYCDLLKIVLKENGQGELASAVPDLSLWLEFGASQSTQVSLMGMGLSRTTALAVAELIGDDGLDEEQCRARVRAMRIESQALSPIVIAEVQRLLAGEAKSA